MLERRTRSQNSNNNLISKQERKLTVMYDVANNLHEVLGNLPDGVKLVAISKFHPNEYLEVAYREGQRDLWRKSGAGTIT